MTDFTQLSFWRDDKADDMDKKSKTRSQSTGIVYQMVKRSTSQLPSLSNEKTRPTISDCRILEDVSSYALTLEPLCAYTLVCFYT